MNDGTNFNYPAARATALIEWLTLATYIAPRCNPVVVEAACAMDENSLAPWHRLARWALFELKQTEKARPLIPYEESIRRIAERLYDVTKTDYERTLQ
jgi:hypothetical protein